MRILASIIAALIAITIHEAPKSMLAVALGDKTPQYQGKLTLNPLKHMDPIGFLVLMLSNIGWSSPVEFNPNNFKHKKRDTVIVALSGIIISLVVAYFTFIAAVNMGMKELVTHTNFGQDILHKVALNSLGLAAINLLPITPFSITKIIAVFSPRNYFKMIQNERTFHTIFLLLYFMEIIPIAARFMIAYFYRIIL